MTKTGFFRVSLEVLILFWIMVVIYLIRDYDFLSLKQGIDFLLVFRPGRYDFLNNDVLTMGQSALMGALNAYEPVAYFLSPVGYVFIHGNWFHLVMNMALLLAYGKVTAQQWGRIPWLLFFFAASAFSAFFAGYIANFDALIGASGAISALIMAVLMSSLLGVGIHSKQSAFPQLIMWVVLLVVVPWVAQDWLFDLVGNISWQGHLGGLLFGAILGPFMSRK